LIVISGRHIRAARGLLGWTQGELSKKAKVALGTIRRMEDFDGPVRARTETLGRVVAALEKASVDFLDDGLPESGSSVSGDVRDRRLECGLAAFDRHVFLAVPASFTEAHLLRRGSFEAHKVCSSTPPRSAHNGEARRKGDFIRHHSGSFEYFTCPKTAQI